jgi:hypothetical protein
LALVVVLSVIAGPASAQNPGQVAILGCKNAVARQVRTQSPGADNIRFSSNPTVTDKSKKEAAVSGAGQFTDRDSGQTRHFTYECTYNTHSAETRALVRMSGAPGQ